MTVPYANGSLGPLKRSAVISDDGLYRYSLRREWGGHPKVVTFVMLNPSIADAEVDDPTIRRCVGFAKSWKFGGLVVVNLFALRATDPRRLSAVTDPVGPDNHAHVRFGVRGRQVVAAWGAHRHMPPSAMATIDMICREARDLVCLGTTRSGAPRHPLYMPKTAERVPWPRRPHGVR